MLNAVESGAAHFSVEREDGGRREAYVDDLTEAQLKFIFHAQNERERMKKKKAEKNTSSF